MLDAVDARADARPNAGITVGVRGDLDAGAMCLVGDGVELFVGVLLRPGEAAVRHHSS